MTRDTTRPRAGRRGDGCHRDPGARRAAREEGTPRRRAVRLVRAYPRHWQHRYGAEMVELLAEDIARRPRSLARTADVGLNAGMVRLRSAGLVGPRIDASPQIQSGLAAVFVAMSTSLLLGLAMLSQIAVGWRWEPPSGRAITVAMIIMATTAAAISLCAVLATVPLLGALARSLATRRSAAIWRPLAVAFAGMGVVVLGAHHFQRGWPGSGGHPWAYHAFVPAGPASFVWAVTLSITSYWAHPDALRTFPGTELAWMATSPLALVATIAGVVKILRRVELSPRALRFEARLANIAVVLIGAFLAGATCWVTGRDPAIHGGLYQVGAVDVVELAVMLGAVALAWAAAGRASAALRAA